MLNPRNSAGGEVNQQDESSWTLRLRAGSEKTYRWAQIDDYIPLPRRAFRWRAPLRLRLRARMDEPSVPGTWGFGLWNDPFALNLLGGGTARRLPALPNAAWFFYALPPNYLTLRDDLAGDGFLAQVFRSPRIPSLLLAPGCLALPLLSWRRVARLLRKIARHVIREDSMRISVDVTQWHAYELLWLEDAVHFTVDGNECLTTPLSPRGPLGLVLWIDNQYMAFPPDGRLRLGVLPVGKDATLELREIEVEIG
jgi:hypothetical protein